MNRTLLFQRKERLFTMPFAGGIKARPRHIVDLPGVNVRDAEYSMLPIPAWSASADGERLVYVSNRESDLLVASAGAKPYMERVPSVVRYVSLAGLRQNRFLFTLPGRESSSPESPFTVTPYALRNAKGQVVMRFSTESNDDDDDDSDVGNWSVAGVALCSTRPWILVSLRSIVPTNDPLWKTCAVELRHKGDCVAVTDRKGRWGVLSEVRDISERDGLLIGITWGWKKNFLRYHYVDVATVDGRSAAEPPLLRATFDSEHEPPYAQASAPSLAPDLRTVAFASGGGIWLVDRHTRRYQRLTHEPGIRQIYWESPTSLLFLKGVNCCENAPADLFRVTLDRHYHRLAHRPTRLMENVDRFQLLNIAS